MIRPFTALVLSLAVACDRSSPKAAATPAAPTPLADDAADSADSAGSDCGHAGPVTALRAQLQVLDPQGVPGTSLDLEVRGVRSDLAPVCKGLVSLESERVNLPSYPQTMRVHRPCGPDPLPAPPARALAPFHLLQTQTLDAAELVLMGASSLCVSEQTPVSATIVRTTPFAVLAECEAARAQILAAEKRFADEAAAAGYQWLDGEIATLEEQERQRCQPGMAPAECQRTRELLAIVRKKRASTSPAPPSHPPPRCEPRP